MDFTANNHGSIVILYALTEAAETWIEEHLPADRMTWGRNGTVVEPRYVVPIIEGLIAEGFTVAQNAQVQP